MKQKMFHDRTKPMLFRDGTVPETVPVLSQKVSDGKGDLQGHWQWCHSIGHIWFPISVPLQLCLAPLMRYYHLLPKTVTLSTPIRSSLSSKAKHLIYSTCIQNFATVASIVSVIWLRALKLKMGHLTVTTPLLGVICPPYAGTWYDLPVYINLITLASAIPGTCLVPTKI